tara:strand:+ start:4525 stop:5379 length:855 start_codon:yes stop_codon:yes gene_type:complete
MNKAVTVKQIKDLRNKITDQTFNPITLAVANVKGGISKTTTATLINGLLKKAFPESNSTLLDFDYRSHSTFICETRNQNQTDKKNQLNSKNYFAVLDSLIRNNGLSAEEQENLVAMPEEEKIETFFEILDEDYPIKVCDLSANDTIHMRTSMVYSNVIIVPTSSSILDLMSTVETLQTIKELFNADTGINPDDYIVKILPAKVKAVTRSVKDKKIQVIKDYIAKEMPEFSDEKYFMDCCITDRVAYQKFLEQGKLAFETYDPVARIECDSLLQELKKIIVEHNK